MTCSGQRLVNEIDDKPVGGQQYAESDCAEIFSTSGTGATLTMATAGALAALTLGNTTATGDDLANSFTAKGITVDLAAGSFTIDKSGLYQLYFSGQVTGEEDEDVTLEWAKGGTALNAPHQLTITYGIATTVEGCLVQLVAKQSTIALNKGDVITLTALGSASEVVVFKDFVFGLRQVGSRDYL